ncbi:MAG: DUF4974 domain-containing protein [Prevotellaceae bacterium]|nr:DUF4974 domain-containing protein [Prevotellaceae bacterium]
MKDYVKKIIALYTQSSSLMEAGARRLENERWAQETFSRRQASLFIFHEWLADGRLPEEKESALWHLWNSAGRTPGKSTRASLASLRRTIRLAKEKSIARFRMWRYAAAVAVIAALPAAFMLQRLPPEEVTFIEHFTDYGKSDIFTLPDGSVVQANSGTFFVYPDHFGQGARTLYLSGEANFKVTENKDAPFIVRTKHLAVTALGTEFNVTGYANSDETKATLISGSIRVAVKDNPAGFILVAGEQLAYNAERGSSSIRQAHLHDETAWQRGELIFRGAMLKEILPVLERKYAVSFQYNAGTLSGDRFNFHFQQASTLEEIMDIIVTVAGSFDYTITKYEV